MTEDAHVVKSLPALVGLKVVQWSDPQGPTHMAAAYAGKLLLDFGAQVTAVCHGAPTAGLDLVDDYLNAGKQQVTLDPQLPAAQVHARLSQLLSDADILIDEQTPAQWRALGLAPDALLHAHPRLSIVSVTPFGHSGPYCDYRAGDLELSFIAGLAHLTPRDVTKRGDGGEQPPLRMPGALVSIYAGVSVAGAALTAVRGRATTGHCSHMDVSMLETMIPTLRRELALCDLEDVQASRFMRVWRLAPWGVKPCRDGHVFLQVVEKHHWLGLVEMMGSPQWALDERYCDPLQRFEHRVEIEEQMAPWLAQQTRQGFTRECQRRNLPFAPVNTLDDLLHIPQLHARCFFSGNRSKSGDSYVAPTHPYVFDSAAIAGVRAAPPRKPGDRQGPLSGLRVLDFGHVWAGPYCAATLADMGAEVIRIESAHRLDVHRRQGPYPANQPGLNRSAVWNSQNRGKQSLTLNLSTARGRELAREMAAQADVVIENFAPGVMQRMGLGYEQLRTVHPGLVMVSLSAFGQSGPQAATVGYGPSLDAWSGVNVHTAYRGGPPNALGGIFPDTGSALYGACALLAALERRDRTGAGCHIDVSELEVSILFVADLFLEQINVAPVHALGNSHPSMFPHGCYRCAGEDAWIALSVPDAKAWQGLCSLLERPDWAADPEFAAASGRIAHGERIEAAISAWALPLDPQRAMRMLQERGVPAAPAYDASALLSDPHLQARGFFRKVRHPEVGDQTLYGPIWRVVRGAGEDPSGDLPPIRPAPLLGQHSHELLRSILGMGDGEIERLAHEQVIY